MGIEILEKLQIAFRKAFDDKTIIIGLGDSADTINKWDSLSQVDLISEIEIAFQIKIDFFEMVELDSVDNIIELVKSKISKQINN